MNAQAVHIYVTQLIRHARLLRLVRICVTDPFRLLLCVAAIWPGTARSDLFFSDEQIVAVVNEIRSGQCDVRCSLGEPRVLRFNAERVNGPLGTQQWLVYLIKEGWCGSAGCGSTLIAFSDAEVRVIDNAFGLDPSAVQMPDFSKPESVAALKSIPISPSQPKENKIKLNIEHPDKIPDEKLELSRAQGSNALMNVLGGERDKLENNLKHRYPDDKCYYGAISSGFSQTAQAFTAKSINDLAVDITILSLGNIQYESDVNNALLGFVLDVGAAYFKNDQVDVAVARSIVERTIGYILPIVAAQDPENPPEALVGAVEELSVDVVRNLIEEEGVVVGTSVGTNEKYRYRIANDVPLTNSVINWYYSPTTHYLTAFISAQCESAGKGFYSIRFQLEKSFGFGRAPADDKPIELMKFGSK